MSIEENKAIVRRYIEELNRRNVSVIDEVIAENLTVQILHHSPPSAPEWVGREAVHQGEFNPRGASGSGITPTGKVITGAAITFYRIVDGKIAEMRAL